MQPCKCRSLSIIDKVDSVLVRPRASLTYKKPSTDATCKQVETILPFNLRPTTRECLHLVTRGHFRSCDKDGGHTFRYTISENPMLYANFMALFYIIEVIADRSSTWQECGFFTIFVPVTLTLSRWPSYTKLDQLPLEIYRMCEKELPTWRLLKVIVCQTDITKII